MEEKDAKPIHKEWTEAGVKALRATTHRRVKEFGYSCRQGEEELDCCPVVISFSSRIWHLPTLPNAPKVG